MREYQSAAVASKSDTVDLLIPCLGFVADADGTVKVNMIRNGTAIVLTVVKGVVYPIRAKRIYSTGTTPNVTVLW